MSSNVQTERADKTGGCKDVFSSLLVNVKPLETAAGFKTKEPHCVITSHDAHLARKRDFFQLANGVQDAAVQLVTVFHFITTATCSLCSRIGFLQSHNILKVCDSSEPPTI